MTVRLFGSEASVPVAALVDSGSEHIIVAPWLAGDAGVDLTVPKYEAQLGVGGANLVVRFGVDPRETDQGPTQ
ncbi:MAG: hypothetical protein J2P57_01710 [Acidimicrobiaceae bacterium]|nr:hypothetical protein [Acidimicrobiaceae bacterium]